MRRDLRMQRASTRAVVAGVILALLSAFFVASQIRRTSQARDGAGGGPWTIQGRVVRREDEGNELAVPVANATVRIDSTAVTTTDPDGRFEVPDLARVQIRGRVLQAGRPFAAATVRVYGTLDANALDETCGDADGGYALELAQAGVHVLVVTTGDDVQMEFQLNVPAGTRELEQNLEVGGE